MCTIRIVLLNPVFPPSCPFQLENEAGTWVKLSDAALKQFACRGPMGYALAYSKEKEEAFLDEVEVSTPCISL